MKNQKYRLTRKKMNIHHILREEVEQLDAIIQKTQWNQQCHWSHKYASPHQDTDAESCSVRSMREVTRGIERSATLIDKK